MLEARFEMIANGRTRFGGSQASKGGEESDQKQEQGEAESEVGLKNKLLKRKLGLRESGYCLPEVDHPSFYITGFAGEAQ